MLWVHFNKRTVRELFACPWCESDDSLKAALRKSLLALLAQMRPLPAGGRFLSVHYTAKQWSVLEITWDEVEGLGETFHWTAKWTAYVDQEERFWTRRAAIMSILGRAEPVDVSEANERHRKWWRERPADANPPLP